MPFDPNPTETKPDVFSLEGLRDWLAGEIAAGQGARTYDYFDSANCLLCHYFRSNGVALAVGKPIGGGSWKDAAGQRHDLPALFNYVAVETPHRISAAHDRTVALIQGARR